MNISFDSESHTNLGGSIIVDIFMVLFL